MLLELRNSERGKRGGVIGRIECDRRRRQERSVVKLSYARCRSK